MDTTTPIGASAHLERCCIFVVAVAACSAQGLQAGAQLWLSASQQQAVDCVAALGSQGSVPSSADARKAQAGFAMSVLRRCDADCATANVPGCTGARAGARTGRCFGWACNEVTATTTAKRKQVALGLAGCARLQNRSKAKRQGLAGLKSYSLISPALR